MKKLIMILIPLLSACTTREEVEADIWNLERVPESICNQAPQLWNYGMFRVVLCKNKPESEFCKPDENGKIPDSFEEFIPYCDKATDDYLGMHQEDATKWLDKLTRPKRK